METRTCGRTALFRYSVQTEASRRFHPGFQFGVIRRRLIETAAPVPPVGVTHLRSGWDKLAQSHVRRVGGRSQVTEPRDREHVFARLAQ